MHVIGTAGHVDHGKSTLIAALTGINPDRLKEEQEREMTIDLGFAWMKLPGGEEIGIIDVPGHRDFIENMLAGVGGIDAALLVIAADEGIMLQTREHLAILDLLGINNGIIVLTKVDLAEDTAWLELVEEDIRKLTDGTSLHDAPIVRVSSRTRFGLDDLVKTIESLLRDLPGRQDMGRPRLPIDRVFSIAGFGTVVTGTLTDGHLSIGDEIEILPSGTHGRIRGLQTHKKKETDALPGSRTAVNITGVDVEQIQRGEVITLPGMYQPTRRLDIHFHLLPDVAAPLHHHMEAKLFLGTAETVVDVRLLGTELLHPGETGWLQLELRDPVVAVRGDRYILRRPSPGETLGGGLVVDAHPKERHKRFDAIILQGLERMVKGSPQEIVLQAAIALGPATAEDILARSKLDVTVAEGALEELFDSNQALLLDDLVITLTQWIVLKENILGTIRSYHSQFPLRSGIPREELKSRSKLSPRLFTLVMTKLSEEASLSETSRWISLPGHQIEFTPLQQSKVDHLLTQFSASPLAPPSIKDCQAAVGEEIFKALLENGTLLAVSNDIVFAKKDYDQLIEKTATFIRQKGEVTLADVRDHLGTSRRYIQALLEYMDVTDVTVRTGDTRKLRG